MLLACNESEDLLTSDAKEGTFVSISGSSGSLAGSPEADVELDEAEIDFQAATLTYKIKVSSPNAADVSQLVVKKTFKGQTVEVASASGSEIDVTYDEVGDFLEGFTGITANSLRVGDVINFQTEIVMNDGRVLVNPGAALNVQVSCLSDLTGTYSVTNTSCPGDPDFPFLVTITKNPDGSYHLSSADGGFLHRCTANTTLINAGNIVEQCGSILASDDLDFGSITGTYDIGDITGGTWDAENGILTLKHKQTFFATRPAEWTSTYVRQ